VNPPLTFGAVTAGALKEKLLGGVALASAGEENENPPAFDWVADEVVVTLDVWILLRTIEPTPVVKRPAVVF
jgi:hypothetical protein